MSQAEELLNSLDMAESASRLANASDEPHIVIGADRYITVPEELQRLAVQYDHNIETVTFDCPRYWDNIDMSTMEIYINYRCPGDTLGSYKAQNVTVDSEDDSIMHFDWTISKNVTLEAGKLTFIICIRKLDEDGNEVNHWNSELYSDCTISEGMEYEGEILATLFPDIVDQYLQAALEAGFRGEKGDQGVSIVSIELEVDEDYVHTHVWDDGIITSAPTCVMPGTIEYTCTSCGETKTGSIPTSEHAWNTGEIIIEATCTTAGEKICTCSNCGTSKTITIPALGHEIVTVPGYNATCTTDGLSDGSHCSRCGTVLAAQETIPAFGHSMNNGVCERCGYTTPTSYYTEIQFDNVSVYKSELNPDISPVLVIDVTSTGFTVIDNNTAKQVYEYTYSGSEPFTGLATYAGATAATYAVGAGFTVGGTSDNSINKFYTVNSATTGTTYTTTIRVNDADYWTSPTATENASPEMTIAVREYTSDKLYFTYSYQGSQIGMYSADSTDVTAFKYNGTEYTSDQSFTIGGETGQNTIANIYTVTKETMTYIIATKLTKVSGASTNPTTIAENGTAALRFAADSGYYLPRSVTVTGATYDWNKDIGKLTLSNPTENVLVTVIASDVSEVTPDL